jgi:predicted AAA+ superfamily ATPase
MFERAIILPGVTHSFFLWGPRLCGKTTLLLQRYPDAVWYDLLQADVYLRMLTAPQTLREELLSCTHHGRHAQTVVLDEVQKVPALLDEVHWLMTHTRLRFVLCGSSPRKLRRGHANLLGGRALRAELLPLTSAEVPALDLVRAVNHGLLPTHYGADAPDEYLRAYVRDYLQEEVAAEALLRQLPVFARFLEVAALGDTECLCYTTVARDCGVSAPTVKAYYQILEDTLLGAPLPPYRLRPKRRVIEAPKWYFFDAAIAGFLSKRGRVTPGSELFGKAFESFMHHELRAYAAYSGKHFGMAYWRTAGGVEVDFVLGAHEVALEVKATPHARADHARSLQSIAEEYTFKRRIMVTLDPVPRRMENGVEVVPWREFCRRLWAGEVL